MTDPLCPLLPSSLIVLIILYLSFTDFHNPDMGPGKDYVGKYYFAYFLSYNVRAIPLKHMTHPLEGTFKMDQPPSEVNWTKKEPPLESTFVKLGPPSGAIYFGQQI